MFIEYATKAVSVVGAAHLNDHGDCWPISWVRSDTPRPGYESHGLGSLTRLAQQCAWWNSTAGGAMYYEAACDDLGATLLWWTPLWVLIAAFLLIFPVLFLVCRYCCNCCGGRLPSSTCCCPTSAQRRSFPKYSKCSIWSNKIVLFILMSLSVGGAVISIHNNARVHADMKFTVLATPVQRPAISFNFSTLNAEATKVHEQFGLPLAAPIVSRALIDTIVTQDKNMQSRLSDIDDRVSDVRERGEKIRALIQNTASGCLALTGVIVLVVALFNGGALLPAGQLLTSWFVFFLLLIVGATGLMRLGQAVVCGAFDESVVPIAVSEAGSRGVCNVSSVEPIATSIHTSFKAAMTNRNDAVCKVFADACQHYNCAPRAALSPCGKAPSTVTLDAAERYMKAVTMPGSSFSMWQCAMDTSTTDCADRASLRKISDLQKAARVAISAATAVVGQDANCTWLTTYMNTTVHDRVCDSAVKTDVDLLLRYSGYGALFAFFALIPMIRGIKRFRCDCCDLTEPDAELAAAARPLKKRSMDDMHSGPYTNPHNWPAVNNYGSTWSGLANDGSRVTRKKLRRQLWQTQRCPPSPPQATVASPPPTPVVPLRSTHVGTDAPVTASRRTSRGPSTAPEQGRAPRTPRTPEIPGVGPRALSAPSDHGPANAGGQTVDAPVTLSRSSLTKMYLEEKDVAIAALIVVGCWSELVTATLPCMKGTVIIRVTRQGPVHPLMQKQTQRCRDALERCVVLKHFHVKKNAGGHPMLSLTSAGASRLSAVKAKWAAGTKEATTPSVPSRAPAAAVASVPPAATPQGSTTRATAPLPKHVKTAPVHERPTPPSPDAVLSPPPAAPVALVPPGRSVGAPETLDDTPLTTMAPRQRETPSSMRPAAAPANSCDPFDLYNGPSTSSAPTPALAKKKQQVPTTPPLAQAPYEQTTPAPAIASKATDAFFEQQPPTSLSHGQDNVEAAVDAFFPVRRDS